MNTEELIYHLNDIRLQLNDGTHGQIQGEILHLIDELRGERDTEPNRLKLVQETVHSIMNSCKSDNVKDKCFRNAARFVQNAIDGTYPDFEVIPDDTAEGPVWIPISEKLPSREGWFYTTYVVAGSLRPGRALCRELYFKDGKWLDNIRIDMCDTYDVIGFGKSWEKHKLTSSELDCDWTLLVVAWMELPQPYDKFGSPERSADSIKIKSLEEIQAQLECGRVYFIDDFTKMVEDDTITEDDGLGYFHDGVHEVCSVFEYNEYNIEEAKEKNAKYVVWYNK